MARLRYTGESWTVVGPDEIFVTTDQVVDLPLDEGEVAKLLSTGDWQELGASKSSNSDTLWGSGIVRAFLSHKAEYKTVASAIKDELRRFGVAAFVAHEDITPTTEWQEEIRRALDSMHLMIALLTEDFRQSEWTGQEIGYALARDVPVIPIRHGSDPFGFIGKYQAVNWQGGAYGDLAAQIFGLILASEQPAIRRLGTDAYVCAVSDAPNYDTANLLASFLPKVARLSTEQVAGLVQAFNTNPEVRNSFGFRQSVARRLSEITGDQYIVSQERGRDRRLHRATQ